jgi:hypothetical protein
MKRANSEISINTQLPVTSVPVSLSASEEEEENKRVCARLGRQLVL